MEQKYLFNKWYANGDTNIEFEGQILQSKLHGVSNMNKYEQTQCLSKSRQKEQKKTLDLVTQITIEIHQKQQLKQSGKLQLSQKQQRIMASSNLMEMVNHYIFEIADRNEAYTANYAHFLILLYLTIKQITLLVFPSQNLVTVMKYIEQKLQRESLRAQISEQTYYDFMTLIMRKQKMSVASILAFMRRFLREERGIAVGVFPYYFNLFALVVNKQVIFNGAEQSELIEYAIDFKHQNRYAGTFTREEVFNQMRLVELLSIQKYHSQEL